MSKSNDWESDLLKLLFQNAAAALIGDSGGLQPSATAGSVYISLHNGDPGEAGNQSTNETAYAGYSRVGVARDNTHWTVSGVAPTQVTNANIISFASCVSGSDTLTYFGVGVSSSGTGKLLYSGTLTSPLAVSTGITPQFTATSLVVTED